MMTKESKPYYLTARAIILNEKKHCLMLQRAQSSKHFAGLWEFPGGKIDQQESLSEGLIREVQEETGLQVVLQQLEGCAEVEFDQYRVAYLFFSAICHLGELKISDEHDAFEWVGKEDLRMLNVSPHLKDMVSHVVHQMM